MDYSTFFLISSALNSQPVPALLESLPFFLCGFLSVIFLIMNLIYPNPLIVLIPIFAILTWLNCPSFETIQFKESYFPAIATHVYSEELKNMDGTQVLNILKYNTENEKEQQINFWKKSIHETEYYLNFKNQVLSQIPYGMVINSESVADILSPLFIKCMDNQKISSNLNSIKGIKNDIAQKHIFCAKKAAEIMAASELIKNVVPLKN